MKKILVLLAIFSVLPVFAVSLTIDNIEYNVNQRTKEASVIGCTSGITNAVIQDLVEYEGSDYPVTSIGPSAFSGCSGLTSVTIPASLTTIEGHSFLDCYNLNKVEITDLTAWCKIKFASFAGNPLYYAKHLYLNGSEVKDLVIPDSVTTIGWHAFVNCTGLTSVTIPNSVTSIGSMAFSGCIGLTSVTIPNSVTSIGGSAFYSCIGLTDVTIPNSVTSIDYGVFTLCYGLTSVTIPNSVTSIGDRAFAHCSGLTTVTIPNSVTSIGDYAFLGCSGLSSVTIPASVTSIGDQVFFDCIGLTSVTIPNSVTTIGNSTFSFCHSLTSVTIPNSVTTIGGSAFYYCSGLKDVEIGNSVTSIEGLAFANCSNLENVYCYAITPPNAEDSTFENSYPSLATLHVPKGSLKTYQSTDVWNDFGTNIDDLDSDGLSGVSDVMTDDHDRPVDVYTTSGVRLMHQVKRDAVNTLPAGLYIVDGKKVLVK